MLPKLEQDVLDLLFEGHGNREIGHRLGLSVDAVKSRLKILFRCLGAKNRTDAAACGIIQEHGSVTVANFDILTDREREVVSYVAEGIGNKAIGEELGITASGVRDHLTRILRKLGLPGRAALAASYAQSLI